MLSAVAARKLRLQGKLAPTEPTPAVVTPPVHPSDTTESSAATSDLSEPTSKRKPSDSHHDTRKRKKKQKSKHVEPNPAPVRYHQKDAFEQQNDVILLASDEEHSDVASSPEIPVHDGYAHPMNMQPASEARPIAKRRRAWSSSAPLIDSSDEEQDPAEVPTTDALGTSKHRTSSPIHPAVLSTFEPILDSNMFHLTLEEVQQLQLDDTPSEASGTVLVLLPVETVALVGSYLLTVLRGNISISGVTLPPSRNTQHVFAPRSSPIPIIEYLSPQDSRINLPSRVRSAAIAKAAIILLRDLHTGIEGLGTVCPIFNGVFSTRPLGQKPDNWSLRSVSFAAHQAHDIFPFVVPSLWETAISAALEHVRFTKGDFDPSRWVYFVKGPRNSGKSALARTLLNRLSLRFRKVAFLECDVGQSEFTPGGMVSLNVLDRLVIGPPFTHPSVPYAAHYIGAASPRACPGHYLECVQALIHIYNIDLKNTSSLEEDNTADGRISGIVPLVVNTMGWSKGLGADLTRKLEEMVEPSDIFELEALHEDGWTPDSLVPSTSNHLQDGIRRYRLNSVPPSVSHQYSAADHRTASLLSYFYSVFFSAIDSPAEGLRARITEKWDFSLPLCAQLPYEVRSRDAFDAVVLVGAGMEDILPSEVHRVLNGAVIGLVRCDSDALDDIVDGDVNENPDASTRLRYKQGGAAPSPPSSSCLGLALVRSLSLSDSGDQFILHVLTPLPAHLLSSVRLIVKGPLEIPVWGMLDFRTTESGDVAGFARTEVPYLKWGKSEGAGGDRRRIRRNLMRRAQM